MLSSNSCLTYGGFWRRSAAQIIDSVITIAATFALSMVLSTGAAKSVPEGTMRNLLVLLAVWLPFFFLPPCYEALMLSMKNGQTVGKLALGVRVTCPDGSPITARQAWGRAVVRHILVAGVTPLAIVDYSLFFFTHEKTTLHDKFARTRVVETP